MNTTQKSINKVYEYLKDNKTATPTELTTKLNLNYGSVLSCIEFLKGMDKVNSVSNGEVTIVSFKEAIAK